ncbi:MAG: HPP family protein [Gammaproteobacteria bacterium]|nr:HPP family protein [Gammaproteobacteria bacterium]
MMQKTTLLRYLGVDLSPNTHHEKIISAIGGGIGIFCVYIVSTWFVGIEEAVYIVPSIGASAVLLFAVPHSPLAQPWNVFGGHFISATAGVICAQFIPVESIAITASVGLAIGAMYYTRCIHPPGAATALAAVIGGTQIHALGFQYIITPVLINTVTILIVALLFNYLFKWRRYPSYLALKNKEPMPSIRVYRPLTHADLVYALSQLDSFIDVTEEDLLKIYKLATERDVNHKK